MMEPRQCDSALSSLADRVTRLVCFLVFSSAAMATIGLSVLAQPLAQRFSDSQTLKAHSEYINQLQTLKTQQDELLANADHSVIVERAAMTHLNYRPVQVPQADAISLSGSWPGLEAALAGVFPVEKAAPAQNRYQRCVQRLAEKPKHQKLLLALGCALAVVSLACFECATRNGNHG